jgi:hypothetical protein
LPRTLDPDSDSRVLAQRQAARLVVLLVVVVLVAVAGIVVGALGLRGTADPGVAASPSGPPAPPIVFGSMDIGFAEAEDDLDEIAEFVPGASPIIRVLQDWPGIQQTRDAELDFTLLDEKIRSVRDRGWRVLLVLGDTPPWASERDPRFDRPDQDPQTWFPADDAAWGNIVRRTVQRYVDDVQAYEVWNKPNDPNFGKYADNSTAERRTRYWQLVKIAYEQVHAACAHCVVIAGPSTKPDTAYPEDDPAQWLDWGYQYGYGEYFDALAFHPYPQPVPTAAACDRPWENLFGPLDDQQPCGGISAMRSVMVRNRDGDKKIWATEWGTPFPPEADPSLVGHATAFADSVRLWRELPYAGPLFLYTLLDPESCAPGPCWGVATRDGVPKQPQYSMLSLALRFVRPECGESLIEPAVAASDVLEPGQCWRSIWTGDRLVSANGHVRLRLTADGHLVLLVGEATVWTAGDVRGVILRNQVDGNVVLLDQQGSPVWSTNSSGRGPSNVLVTDDGNMVVRTLGGQVTWISGTHVNGQIFRNSQDRIAVGAGGALVWFDDWEQAAELGYEMDALLTVPDDWASSQPTKPRDGTLINDVSGRIGVMAGGGVLWFGSPDEFNAAYPGQRHIGMPDSFIRTLTFPADGTLVRTVDDPQVWRLESLPPNGRRTAVTPGPSDMVFVVGALALSEIPVA